MSALLTGCICIGSESRTLNRAGIEKALCIGEIIQNRHILAACMDEITVIVIDIHIGSRHIHMLAGNIDNQIRTFGHIDFQFQIAIVEYFRCLCIQIQHVQVRVGTGHVPAQSVVLVDFECCIFLGFCKHFASFAQQCKFLVKVDQLTFVQLTAAKFMVFRNLRINIFRTADNEFFTIGLEIREGIAADNHLCSVEFFRQLCTDRIILHLADIGITACGKSALTVGAVRVKIPAQKDGKL